MTTTSFQKLKPTAIHPLNALGAGMRLQEFEIRTVIGEGGFGIVYHAFDTLLERDVAIKEYLPVSHAVRANDGSVVARSERHAETFAKGLMYFLSEARMLARFKHAALVEVFRFWEENGTAYMVMPYYRGSSLNQMIQAGFRVENEDELMAFLDPLMQGLKQLHEASCFHRDIATDNILMLESGEPVLLDFGAARSILVGEAEHSTVILKPGFAPVEQYSNDRQLAPQGAWTDLYALCAVAYQLITGDMPVMSVARIMRDPLVPLSTRAPAGFSAEVLQAIDCGMKVDPASRPQSVDELSALLHASAEAARDGIAPDLAAPLARAAAEAPPAASPDPLAPVRAEASATAQGRAPSPNAAAREDDVPPPSRARPTSVPRRRSAWRHVFGAAGAIGALAAAVLIYQSMNSEPISLDNGVAIAATDQHAMPFGIQPAPGAADADVARSADSPFTVDPASVPTHEVPTHDEAATPGSAVEHGLASPVAPAVEQGPGVGPATVGPATVSAAAQTTATQAAGTAEAPPAGKVVDGGVVARGEVRQVAPQDTEEPAGATSVPTIPAGEGAGTEATDAARQAPDHGVVEVTVAPWGNVYLNGQLVGVAPPRVQIEAGLGANEVVISNETHPPRTVSLFVEPGKTYRIRHDFTKQ